MAAQAQTATIASTPADSGSANVIAKDTTTWSVTDGAIHGGTNVREIAFVDPSVADLDVLLKGMRRDVAVNLLSSAEPAPLQMARVLSDLGDLEVIHVIAHGQAGEVSFAAGVMSLETIGGHRGDLAAIGRSLAADGEIRLWVCSAAEGERGAAFVDTLARATGATVSAATGLVGAAAHGGRWELDVRAAGRPVPPLTRDGVAGYAGVLATFTALAGTDTFNGTTASDTFVIDTGTVSNLDTFNAGGSPGVDTIQIGTAAAGTSVDLSSASTGGVLGFVGFEAITFVNTSGTSTATFNGAQFTGVLISNFTAITGTSSGQAIVINAGVGTTFTAAGWTFTTWASGTDTITINGSTGAETLTGSSQIDTITGGTGSDTMTGGAGIDIFNFAAGASALTIGGAGTGGTITGFDTITDFTPGTTVATSEKLGFTAIAVLADTAGANGTDSTLQLSANNSTVASHAITNGIITFDSGNVFGSARSLTTTGDVAAVTQYLQANDIGTTGTTVAFKATISGVTHTYVYTQGSANGSPNSNDVLVDLVDVSATSLSTTGLTNHYFTIESDY